MIDTTTLKEELAGRRWFGDKERAIKDVVVLDEATLADGPPQLIVALVRIDFTDSGQALYHLPLLVDEEGAVTDAFEDVDQLRVLGDLMAHAHSIKGNHGLFHFGGPGLDPLSPPGSGSIRSMGNEQSNTSIVLDEQVILKLFRKVEPGPNPDLELARLLTNEGFEGTPPQVGEILYEGELDLDGSGPGDVSIDLGIAAQFIHDASEGWAEILRQVKGFYDEVHPEDASEDMRTLTAERGATTFELLEELGDVTAKLHVTLAREELELDFVPEPIDVRDINAWTEATRSSLKDTLRTDIYGLGRVEEAFDERIDRLVALEGNDLGWKLRIHGDYHLGQVLIGPRGWMVIDFEGEPRRTIEERRMKQSPLKDVAGMLRSFSYAATAALFERAEPDSGEWQDLSDWSACWEELAREHFLAGYLRTAHEGHFLPADRDHVGVMLDVFEIDKALYELAYERGHRPDWVRIPLRGLHQVLDRSEIR
ncbi:MAG: phosphotransferase [Actinobacteria bacterium]|nr:phosphotransferase [Actinomycetota bacterium]